MAWTDILVTNILPYSASYIKYPYEPLQARMCEQLLMYICTDKKEGTYPLIACWQISDSENPGYLNGSTSLASIVDSRISLSNSLLNADTRILFGSCVPSFNPRREAVSPGVPPSASASSISVGFLGIFLLVQIVALIYAYVSFLLATKSLSSFSLNGQGYTSHPALSRQRCGNPWPPRQSI